MSTSVAERRGRPCLEVFAAQSVAVALQAEDRAFADDAMGELVELEKSFERLGRHLIEEIPTMTADWPRGEIPAGARRAVEEVSLAIAFGRPLPQQTASREPRSMIGR